MTFLAPERLLLLLLPLAAVAAYLWLQRRRRHYAVRFTNLDLLASVAPRRPGWRRHLAAGASLLAMTALVVGLAQPSMLRRVPREQAIVVLAIDVSRSMQATDVDPSRLQAAIDAGIAFVEDLPDSFQVGVVAFGGSARLLAAPTTDHAAAVSAIAGLQTINGTAAGDGLQTALDAIETTLAEAGLAGDGVLAAGVDPDDADAPVATVVVLSDGVSTMGVPVTDAAAEAAEAGVPVSTITYGTSTGVVSVQGQSIAVPPDAATMAEVADLTGGTAFSATSGDELAAVYEDIQARVGTVEEPHDLTLAFLAGGLVLLLGAFAAAMTWTGRFL